jgi:DNA mismatch endonuclease (patch repair protein)
MRSERSFKLGPPPPPSSAAASASMRANVKADTVPELAFRHALRQQGLAGYRLNWKKAPGSPDIAYPGRRIAIFVHGCFWHRCPKCDLPLPKSNRAFWEKKFTLNKERDAEKESMLEKDDWRVFVFWECEVKKDAEGCARKLRRAIEKIDGQTP